MVHLHELIFKQPSGTSRGILTSKPSWILEHKTATQTVYGEVSIIKTLNPEWSDHYPDFIRSAYADWKKGQTKASDYSQFPSLRMGLEMLELGVQQKSPFTYFENTFSKSQTSIPINGLVWMGTKEFMHRQIVSKIEAGFDCIKLKIGAINIEEELDLLEFIRSEFQNDIELRVDANGAFQIDTVLPVLDTLAKLQIHSIEQPIRQGQIEQMQQLCQQTPIPIALDEELIGVNTYTDKKELLTAIQPQYIILKPSLVGGFTSSDEWIKIAEAQNIGWWITSALESNIGLNAIAQYTATKNNPMPQGLGTGQLYTNNFESPLDIEKGHIVYRDNADWVIKL